MMAPRLTRRLSLRLAGAGAAVMVWAAAAALLSRGLPVAILLRGVVAGSLLALGATGIVLVYRTTRTLNFAQAELGVLGAVLAIVMHERWSVPWFPAVLIGVVVGAAVGAVADLAVAERLRHASRLTVMVATVGLAQVLGGGARLLANAAPPGATTFGFPVEVSFGVSGLRFDADTLVALALSGAVLAALAHVLRRTDLGNAVLASADDPDRARLSGIPVTGISAGVWASAACLSTLAVLLRVPLSGATSATVAAVGGAGILLRMLAAAVLGGVQHLPRTALAAVAIGIVEEAVLWTTGRTAMVDAGLVVVIIVALLLQRDLVSRSLEGASTSLLAVREPRPLADQSDRLPGVAMGWRVGPWLAAAAAAALPLLLRPSQEQAAAVICVYAILALSLLVLTGWSGHVSLGQLGFAAVGGATTAVLHTRHEWDLTLAVGAGVVLAAALACVVGLPALRIGGPFLAVTTLAFGLATATLLVERTLPWAVQRELLRPALGGRLDLRANWQVYELCLVGLVGVLVLTRNLRTSRTGRALLAVRDNAPAAAASGLDRVRLTVGSFVLSGAIAGFAGGLYVLVQRGFQPESYSPQAGIRLLAMAVVGGLGSAGGVVVGAVYIRGTELLLPGAWALLASGLGIVVLLLLAPDGVAGAIARGRDRVLDRLTRQRERAS